MSSKRRLRKRSREGKRKHPNQDIAVRVARLVSAKGHGIPMRAYKCPHCANWHIGTPNRRILQAIREKQEGR